MDTLEQVLSRTIYLARVGSHAYGTNLPTSDSDFKGVCIPTKEYFFGCSKHFEQLERQASKGSPADLSVMALAKFCNLAADCNPNIIEILNVDEEDVVHIDLFGRWLRLYRDLFLSRKARFTFAGYAHAQLKRIKTHRSWLLKPPVKKPTREDFGLFNQMKVSKSELGAFESLMKDGVDVTLPKDILTLFVKERQYQTAMTEYQQYENWKAKRNEARAALEAKYGYDTKHGMHLIRLMRMCREILRDGEVIVRRPDAKELLSIRAGEWSYDRIVGHAEELEAECEELYTTSTLPKCPDRARIDDLVMNITEYYL